MRNIYYSNPNKISLIFILYAAFIIASLYLFFKFHKPGTYDAEQSIIENINQQKNESVEKFFLPIIGRRLEKVKLGELKNELVPKGAKEVRIWVGFSHNGFSGLILKNDTTTWSAIYLPDPSIDKALPSFQVHSLPPPKSGWQELSTKLQKFGLYDLPGEPDRVPGRKMVTDAIVAVVEIKTSNSYRAYLYEGLLYYQDEETRKMEIIIDILSSEFGIRLY